MNDYEILYMVCDGEDKNFDLLVNKYRPLIYNVVKEYTNFFKKFGYELEDLMQLGYITLYKTSHMYDIYNHTMFFTYFKKALDNMIVANIRVNTTTKKETLNQALSYDTYVPNTNIRYIELLSDKKTMNDLNSELIIFKNSMPIIESYIFELFYNGYNKKEISILLDEDIEEIKRKFNKIKEHAFTYKSLFFI